MNTENQIIKKLSERRCLACGTTKDMGRRMYCSPHCRQRLLQSLELRIGLLQALGTRFATFYFSESAITLDLLLYGDNNLVRFVYPRTPRKNPADDFSAMANLLGKAWWDERDRTKKRFAANEHVIGLGKVCDDSLSTVKPSSISVPSIKPEVLSAMGISKKDIQTANKSFDLKNVYRAEVKKRHPDVGGNPDDFRDLHKAYKELKEWLSSPHYTTKMGFPDKWFYNGGHGKWFPPQPRMHL
jgi:hypothetical protein